MSLRLLAVFAHPDDETLGMGGTLARYAAEGVETYLLTATRGEKGWFGDPAEYPGPEELGRQREGELQAAAAALGIRETHFLDYVDGDLDQALPSEVVASIATEIRRLKPHVVATFGHDGIYGHPDHIAICQLTTAAVVRAASSDASLSGEPHAAAKLYYMVTPKAHLDAYEAVFGELVMNIDGVERRSQGWPDWAITTRLDTAGYWEQVWQAVQCHRSQLVVYEKLASLPPEHHANLWGNQNFYRAFSTVNGGREREDDLFAGLRE